MACVETATNKCFNNPIAFDGFNDLLVAILNVVIIISVPIIVFFVIYAGFQYVVARGNPEQIKKANLAIVYAIIGGVVIMGSVGILTIIRSVVAEF